MLEVFAYKKYKKHKLDKQLREADAQEALSKQDEEFIQSIADDKPSTPTPHRFKFMQRKKSSRETIPATAEELAAINANDEGAATPTSQKEDFSQLLSSLNLALKKVGSLKDDVDCKTAFSFSKDTRALLKEFTQILKDIQAGGPHAYDDLTTFLQKSNGKLNSLFDSTPDFLKSLISTLPFPLAKKLDKKSPKEVGVDILKDLAKPGVVTGLLKQIITTLSKRFPAFVGSNALLSLGVFVLLYGVWYCYKRGREERLKLESTGSPEALEGERPQSSDIVDHGDGIHASGTQSIPVFHDASMVPAADDRVMPLQGESEPVPSSSKKGRKSWLRGK